MKAENHGRRVHVTDWCLAFTGHLIYTPAQADGFWLGRSILEPGGDVSSLVRGDRIRLIP